MKYLNRLSVFILLASLLLVSCSREDIDETIVGDPEYTPDTIIVNNLLTNLKSNTNDGLDLGCITIEFPFDLLTESDGTVTITSKDEFEDALEMESPDLVVDFVYPMYIIESDGASTQIDDALTLGVRFASCIPETGWTQTISGLDLLPACLFNDFCFDIIYPVELQDEDGNLYTAENDSDFIDLLASYGAMFFVLPVSFEDEDGNEVEVDGIDSFFELAFECEDIHGPSAGDGLELDEFDCFELVFPYDVELEDGSIITVNNEDDYANLVLSGKIVDIVFPFAVQDTIGNATTINSIDDLILVLINCGFIEISDPDSCATEAHVLLFYNALNIFTLNNYPYEISYPVTLIVDGTPVLINNGDDYIPAVGGNPSRIIPAEIVYPVTVTQFGREIVLNSDADVCDFYKTLLEPCENKPAHIQFFFNEGAGTPINCAYFIDYPIDISRNGLTIPVQSRDEYLDELATPNAYDEIELVYPVSVTEILNGQQIVFDSDDDICDYLNECR